MAGRAISTAATLTGSLLVARLVYQAGRYEYTRTVAATAAAAAALMVFTLSPIIAFATLVHVDNLALMFSLAGVALAAAGLDRGARDGSPLGEGLLLYPALLAFVAAIFTKQTCIAAPLAVLLVWSIRAPRRTARAFAAGAVLGAAATAYLTWQTHGGFLRHILTYNINAWRLHNLLVLTGNVIRECGMVIELTLVAVVMQWAMLMDRLSLHGPRDIIDRIRTDRRIAFIVLMTAYLLLSFATALLAGKNGASVNYYEEFLYAACIWLGFLVLLHIGAAASLAAQPLIARLAFNVLLPAVLIWQASAMPRAFLANMNILYGPAVTRDDQALLTAIRGIDKPILSDDIAMVLLAGKQAPIEPFIFSELAGAGLWDENTLIRRLQSHQIGAVITYLDPGDATFAARFLPATTAAIIKYYPRVTSFGDNRLRLP